MLGRSRAPWRPRGAPGRGSPLVPFPGFGDKSKSFRALSHSGERCHQPTRPSRSRLPPTATPKDDVIAAGGAASQGVNFDFCGEMCHGNKAGSGACPAGPA